MLVTRAYQIYIDIYVSISLRGHNLGTFFTRKLKFGMLITQTKTFNYAKLLLGLALGLG